MVELTALSDLEQTPHAEVFETPQPRTVRLHLQADERIPAHSHPGTNIVLYLQRGRLEVTLDGEVYDLRGEELIRFSGDQDISPYAVEASIAILVFCQPSDA